MIALPISPQPQAGMACGFRHIARKGIPFKTVGFEGEIWKWIGLVEWGMSRSGYIAVFVAGETDVDVAGVCKIFIKMTFL